VYVFASVTDLSRGNLSCAVPESEPQTRSILSVPFGAASPRSSADESEQARGRERKRRLRINTATTGAGERGSDETAILSGAVAHNSGNNNNDNNDDAEGARLA